MGGIFLKALTPFLLPDLKVCLATNHIYINHKLSIIYYLQVVEALNKYSNFCLPAY